MVNFMNSTAEYWFDWQIAMLWQTAVLVGIVWLVDLCIRKWAHPQVRYALWVLVLVKLLIPPTWTSPASVTSHIPAAAQKVVISYSSPPAKGQSPEGRMGLREEQIAQSIPVWDQTEAQASIPSPNHTGLTASSPSEGGGLNANNASSVVTQDLPDPSASSETEATESATVSLSWQAYAMLTWVAGMVILAAWLFIRLASLRKEHLSCHPGLDAGSRAEPTGCRIEVRHDNSGGLPERFFTQLQEVAAKLQLKRIPRVILTDKVACPAVFGIFKPVLLMPAEKFKSMTRQDTEHILLHELAHIKRGDLLVHAVYMCVQIVYWFNPMLWMARRPLQNLRELCCDATVAKLLREDTVHYRRTLLETARQLLAEPVDPGLGLLGLFENNNWLLTRLQWLEKNTWKNRPLRIATIIALVAAMATCVLPMASRPQKSNPVPKGSAYEDAKGSKNHKIKVGPTKFEAHTVVRYERNGNPIIKNPDGSEKRVIDMETPDFSAQTKWMDVAQVYLSPEQTAYDVIELRVFNHDTRQLLMEDCPGIGYHIEDSVVTVFSSGKTLPDSVDVWMRVLHRGAKHCYNLQARNQAAVDIDGNTLRVLDIAKGQYSWANEKRGKHHAQWDDHMTSVAMKFDKPGNEKYQICAISTDGRRIVPASPHFLRPSNGWTKFEVALPMDQIKLFEITPFKGRDRFFFDDVRLPPRSGSLDMIPPLRFSVNGQEGKHARKVGTFFTSELTILADTEISEIASSFNGFGSTYQTEESKSLTSLICKIDGIGVKDITFTAYDKQGKLLDLSKPRGSGHTRSVENTVYYIETNIPVETIHTVDVYLKKNAGLDVPSSITPYESTTNYTATLPNGVTVELLGVCKYPSLRKKWYTPDGKSQIQAAPYDELLSGVHSTESDYRWEIAARMVGYDPEAVFNPEMFWNISNSRTSTCAVALKGKKLSDVSAVVLTDYDERKTLDIKLGVAVNEWSILSACNANREYMLEDTLADGHKVFWNAPTEKDGKARIVVYTSKDKGQMRAVAMGRDGQKVHYSGSHSTNKNDLRYFECEFDIPLSKLSEFQLQFRSIEWVTFKNVALRPGGEAEGEIETPSSDPSPQAAEEKKQTQWQTIHESYAIDPAVVKQGAGHGFFRTDYGDVAFGETDERDGKSFVKVIDGIDRTKYNGRIIATDKDDNVVEAIDKVVGHSENTTGTTAFFDLPVKDIKVFRFQIRRDEKACPIYNIKSCSIPIYNRDASELGQYIGGYLDYLDIKKVYLEYYGFKAGDSPDRVFEKEGQCDYYMNTGHEFVPIRNTFIAPISIPETEPGQEHTLESRIKKLSVEQITERIEGRLIKRTVKLQDRATYAVMTRLPFHGHNKLMIMSVDSFGNDDSGETTELTFFYLGETNVNKIEDKNVALRPGGEREGEIETQSSASSERPSGEKTERKSADMEESKLIRGYVTDKSGRPRGNVDIAASLNDLRNAIKTDESGHFALKPDDRANEMWVAYSYPTRATGIFTIPKEYDGKPLHVPLDLAYAKVEGRIVGPDGSGLAKRKIELIVAADKDIRYRSKCRGKTDKYGYYTSSIPCGAGLSVQAKLVNADESEKEYTSQTVALKEGQIFVEIPTFVIGQGSPEISDDGRVHYSGRILNEDAEPIEGVEVKLHYRMSGYMSMGCKEVKTDEQGRWSCRIEKDHSNLSVRLIHPEYLSYHFDQSSRKPSIQELLDGTNVMTLKHGHKLTGTIRDPQGKPIENVLVAAGRLYSRNSDGIDEDATTARTAADGTFRIGGLPADKIDVMISAAGYAPKIKAVEIKPNTEPISVALEKGITYTGQVVDADDNPLEGVKVYVREWRIGNERNMITRITKSDSKGLFTIENLPRQGNITLAFSKKESGLLGFSKETPKDLAGQDRIVMYTVPKFIGTVIDADTGEPITNYEAIHGIKSEGFGDSIHWSKFHRDKINSKDGSFNQAWHGYHISYPFNGACYLKIQADGYLPEITPAVELGKEYEPFVIKLTKAQTLNGTVVDDQGNPAVKAQVGWVGPEQKAFIIEGKFDSASFTHQTDNIVKTNKQGQFKLQPSRDEGLIVVLHKNGYAALTSEDFKTDEQIQLTPWATITGVVVPDKSAGTENTISVSPVVSKDDNETEKISWRFDALSLSQNNFTINYIPSIPLHVGKVIRLEQNDPVYLNPQPGQNYDIQIGGTGCTVTGKIRAPKTQEGIEIAKAMTNPRQVHAAAFMVSPANQVPEEIAGKSRSSFQWLWKNAKDVYPRSTTYHKRFIPTINEIGEFQFENLAPGKYEFVINVHLPLGENVSCGRGVLKGTKVVPFEVAENAKETPIPDITLEMLQYPVAGEPAPDFQAKTFDGKTINLKDFRGKVVLLDFWATWCRPCVDQLPELQEIYNTFNADERFEMISLSLDWDIDKAKRLINDKGLKWHQVSLGDMSESTVVKDYGVGAIPALILLDAEGRIIAQNLSSDNLKSTIQKALE